MAVAATAPVLPNEKTTLLQNRPILYNSVTECFHVLVSLLSLCVSDLSSWWSTTLVQECSYMSDFDFSPVVVFCLWSLVQIWTRFHVLLHNSFRIHMACCTCSFSLLARYGDFDPTAGRTLIYFRYFRPLLFLYDTVIGNVPCLGPAENDVGEFWSVSSFH